MTTWSTEPRAYSLLFAIRKRGIPQVDVHAFLHLG